jgi:NAD(P)-dependent dehydrogenase (short-subunit alcohol dehydrogenase family)
MPRSYVVTGGRRGVGRAVAERLLSDGGAVVIIEFDPEATARTRKKPDGQTAPPEDLRRSQGG